MTLICQCVTWEVFFPANLVLVLKKVNLSQQKHTTQEKMAVVKTEKKCIRSLM